MTTFKAKLANLLVPSVGLFIILLPVLYSATTIDPVLTPRFVMLSLFTAWLLIVLLITKQQLIGREMLKSGWFWASIAFLSFTVLSVFNAVNTAEYIFTLSQQTLLLVYTLGLTAMLQVKANAEQTISRSLIIAGLGISSIAIYQVLQNQLGPTPELDQLHLIKSTLGHKNLLASALLILVPFAVYNAILNQRTWRWISLAFILLTLGLIFYLKTRSVYLGVAAGIVLFGFSGLLARIPRRVIIGLYVVLVTGIFAWFSYQYINYDNLKTQEIAFQIEKENDRTFTIYERELLWNGTLNMTFEESYLGVGAGNWKIQFPKYGSEIWRARQGLVQFQRPHNDLFWVLAEIGILGALAYLTIFALIVILAWQNMANTALSQNQRLLNRLLLSGIIAYLVIANFSFPKERIFHQVVLHTSFALVLSMNLKTTKNKTRQPIATGVLVALCAFCTLLGITRFNGEQFSKELMTYRAHSEWQKTIEKGKERPQTAFYAIDPMAMPVDFYTGLAYLETGQLTKALQAFNLAKNVHPNNVHVLNNLGSNHQLNGNLDSAEYYYSRVVDMAPYYRDGILNLASVLFNNGHVKQAYIVLREYETKFEDDREQYESYLVIILQTILLNLAESHQQTDAQVLIAHQDDKTWLLNCHLTAARNNQTIESIMLQDAAQTAN